MSSVLVNIHQLFSMLFTFVQQSDYYELDYVCVASYLLLIIMFALLHTCGQASLMCNMMSEHHVSGPRRSSINLTLCVRVCVPRVT